MATPSTILAGVYTIAQCADLNDATYAMGVIIERLGSLPLNHFPSVYTRYMGLRRLAVQWQEAEPTTTTAARVDDNGTPLTGNEATLLDAAAARVAAAVVGEDGAIDVAQFADSCAIPAADTTAQVVEAVGVVADTVAALGKSVAGAVESFRQQLQAELNSNPAQYLPQPLGKVLAIVRPQGFETWPDAPKLGRAFVRAWQQQQHKETVSMIQDLAKWYPVPDVVLTNTTPALGEMVIAVLRGRVVGGNIERVRWQDDWPTLLLSDGHSVTFSAYCPAVQIGRTPSGVWAVVDDMQQQYPKSLAAVRRARKLVRRRKGDRFRFEVLPMPSSYMLIGRRWAACELLEAADYRRGQKQYQYLAGGICRSLREVQADMPERFRMYPELVPVVHVVIPCRGRFTAPLSELQRLGSVAALLEDGGVYGTGEPQTIGAITVDAMHPQAIATQSEWND